MRLYPRVPTSIPASVTAKGLSAEGIIANLSMAGALLRSPAALPAAGAEPQAVVVRYRIPGSDSCEHGGTIVRTGEGNYALQFEALDTGIKHRLWKYVADGLDESGDCPYCGEAYSALPEVCGRCGWALTFAAPDYHSYHERRVLSSLLHEGAERLTTDRLRRLVNFMDVELFRRKGGERDQEFVGASGAMLGVFSKIRKVAPTDVPVLILGESGTGKELTALAVHERSPRRDKPFITINCAAIPEGLLEAELFGYERGAFTGAYTGKRGKFEHADGGTIFLDEIGDMPLGLQAKLLRFLQDNIVERIGGLNGKRVDVRLIAATNRDLNTAISEGAFRGDLYYRLDALTISLPPLRERGADKLILARHFLVTFCAESGMTRSFSQEAVDAVMEYAWPGNVREMINKVRRAIIMAEDESITPEDLNISSRPSSAAALFPADAGKGIRERIDTGKIEEALQRCENNISKAARVLGISRTSIYNYKRRYCP